MEDLKNISEEKLLEIIRLTENQGVPGSRYQRAVKELELRDREKILSNQSSRPGIFLRVGGDMVTENGSILADENSDIDIAVAGNYKGKNSKIVQGKQKDSKENLIYKFTNNQTFAVVIGGFVLLLVVYLLYVFFGINLNT